MVYVYLFIVGPSTSYETCFLWNYGIPFYHGFSHHSVDNECMIIVFFCARWINFYEKGALSSSFCHGSGRTCGDLNLLLKDLRRFELSNLNPGWCMGSGLDISFRNRSSDCTFLEAQLA